MVTLGRLKLESEEPPKYSRTEPDSSKSKERYINLKKVFSFVACQDLTEPLTFINYFVGMLMKKHPGLNDDVEGAVKDIYISVENIVGMVNGVQNGQFCYDPTKSLDENLGQIEASFLKTVSKYAKIIRANADIIKSGLPAVNGNVESLYDQVSELEKRSKDLFSKLEVKH
jgi:hypothetical protein